MLYTLGLQFGSEPGAKLFHWGCGWLTAAAIGVWSARLGWEGQRVPAWVGPLASALFITMPVVLWELGTSYVDLGTALFQFLALVLLLESVERDGTGWRLRTPGLAAAAGVLSGFALGTKYTALLQFGLLGIGLLCGLLRSPPLARAGWLRGLLWFGGLGVVVGAPWYVKNWLWVHNPVYPFFFSLFPQSFSWTRHAEIAYQTEQRSFGMGRDLGAALGLFWNLGLHARDFYANLRTLAGDRFGSVGVAWAAAAPLLVWIPLRRWPWPARACLAYAVGSLAAWFLLSHQIRYLIPVFAPLAVVTALLPVLLPGSLLRGSLAACLGASLLLNVKMHQELFQDSLRVVTGQVSREQFLDAYLPGLYEASRYVNGLPTNVRVALYQETRGYYFDRRYFWANPLQHNWIPYDTLPNGRALAGQLRRFGITHVLINYDFCRGVEGASWYRLVMDGVRSGVFRESFRSRVGEPERRGVFIYELEPAS
ncbi:MAG: hypothetical protein FJX77_10475 [Armatimonadetes bacterium]|nr:hypothetical protein [Armatimonadota bacterium]